MLHSSLSAYAYLQDDTLTLGNTLIERAWHIAGPLLCPLRVTDKRSGHEWLAPCAPPETAPGQATLEQHPEDTSVGETALTATVRIALSGQEAHTLLHFRVPHTVAALSLSVERTGEGGDAPFQETLALAPLHLKVVQVELRDQTDAHNELAFEREWLLHPSERALSLTGNLFWVEDVLSERGLIVLKEAPLPHARPVFGEYDLRMTGEREMSVSTLPGIADAGHRTTLLCYEGGKLGRIQALQSYQRSLRGYDPARDGLFLSNTWGDRGQDARLSAEFLAQEIDAAAALGVDVVQIDDGWQTGRTINSIEKGGRWEGFWGETDFWAPDPTRFPNGLAPVAEAARAVGLRIGLWYAPDSADDFAHWQEDAKTLLALHRAYGIDYFKLDGIKIRSARGEQAVKQLFQTLLRDSDGRIVCDLDVTDETRPGYFGALAVGPVFVENRYTDWHRYWPHQTLRNLWKLAHYIDPLRLRMEALNNERNTQLYEGDPLAPARYDAAYLFATVCFACPLGWFETSGLSASYVSSMASFVAVWKAHREDIYRGTILPVGETPNGRSWTGFLSVNDGSHYLLMFRESNDAPAFSFSWPLPAGEYGVDILYGDGHARLDGTTLSVELKEARSFILARLHTSARSPQ